MRKAGPQPLFDSDDEGSEYCNILKKEDGHRPLSKGIERGVGPHELLIDSAGSIENYALSAQNSL